MKKTVKKTNIKYLLFSIFGIISFSIATLAAFSITSNSIFLEKKPENKIDFIGSQNQTYEYNDALEKDVIEKAKSDSVLLYSINHFAVFHRFGSASHLIKILELNPNKEVYFVVRNNINIDLTQIINNKEKFPNFNFLKIDSSMEIGNILINKNFFPNELSDVINKINSQNKKIDFYSDDYFILKPIETMIKSLDNLEYYNPIIWDRIIKNLFNDFKKISEMNSINMFADGTASTDFYSTLFYKLFLFSGNKIDNNNQYVSENFDYKKEGVNDIYNLSLFLSSLITINKKGNDIQKTKYFLPTFQVVNEVNDKAPVLTTNKDEFFNPYNSLEADLISFTQSFSKESWILLNSVFSKEEFIPEDYDFMNNKVNYVYTGRLLQVASIDEEVRKIIQIKNDIESEGVKSFNVIFKGHPRDENANQILTKLKNRIKQLTGDEAAWLFTVNPRIPYEIYLANGTFGNDESKNKTIKLYTTVSTINLFLYAEDPSLKLVEKILINKKEEATILYWFGENTKLFPKEKWQFNVEEKEVK